MVTGGAQEEQAGGRTVGTLQYDVSLQAYGLEMSQGPQSSSQARYSLGTADQQCTQATAGLRVPRSTRSRSSEMPRAPDDAWSGSHFLDPTSFRFASPKPNSMPAHDAFEIAGYFFLTQFRPDFPN